MLKKFMSLFFDKTFLKFVLVGTVNTVVGAGIMFTAYNIFHLSYWVSSALNYVLASILSFFLNKYFTFENNEFSYRQILGFIINIALCYFVAYAVAERLALWIFAFLGEKWQENIAMMLGMVMFTGLNYFGQRFFCFKKSGEAE